MSDEPDFSPFDIAAWSGAAEYVLGEQFDHRASGLSVKRQFIVYAPNEEAAMRTSRIHFLLALNAMGIRFQKQPPLN